MDETLVTLSLTVTAATMPVFGGFAPRATLTRHHSARKLDTALSNIRMTATNPAAPAASPVVPSVARPRPHGSREAQQLQQQIAKMGQRWIDTGLGHRIVTEEDRKLLEECGCYSEHARAVFGGTRILLPPLLVVFGALHASSILFAFVFGFVGFALGYLAPKWLLGRRKESRRRCMDDELPVMVDMLRLLQGVGLSTDQSLQVIANEFHGMLPVLAGELGHVNQQFASGRPREQTPLRIARLFNNEDLKGLITLLTQVDRFGDAVQEPLRQFGERLQENRRARLGERVGRLIVQMTMIMAMTLLPALLIITVGPGFMGVMHSLQQTGGH